MDFEVLARQNPWWDDSAFIEGDPKIRDYEAAGLKWMPRMRKYVDLGKDVLYSIRGPRQVGKTTFVKLLIRDMLKERKASNILYFSCDLVSNPKELHDIIETYLLWSRRQDGGRKLICLDEVSRVRDWESAYKQIVDIYSLRDCTYLLTGSSSWDLKHGVERLGGRKGEAAGEQNHKILLPMKFAEYVGLRSPKIHAALHELKLDDNNVRRAAFNDLTGSDANKWINPLIQHKDELDSLFDEYLLTGGIISAANQYVAKGEITQSTYELYLQLFFGDIAKLKRDENTAKKLLSAALNHPQSPVGWDRLAKEADIPSPPTVLQYADVLQTLFVLNIYHALDQNKKLPKHRSEKKFQIPNPFFFHAFSGYLLNPAGDFFKQAKSFITKTEGKAALAESVVGDHLTRLAYNHRPSDIFDQTNFVFYARNSSGETIDFVVRLPSGLIPVEVKYQSRINPSDYRGIRRFDNGIMVSKDDLQLDPPYPSIPVVILLLFI